MDPCARIQMLPVLAQCLAQRQVQVQGKRPSEDMLWPEGGECIEGGMEALSQAVIVLVSQHTP